jgi:hypothetical protein
LRSHFSVIDGFIEAVRLELPPLRASINPSITLKWLLRRSQAILPYVAHIFSPFLSVESNTNVPFKKPFPTFEMLNDVFGSRHHQSYSKEKNTGHKEDNGKLSLQSLLESMREHPDPSIALDILFVYGVSSSL